MTAIACRKKKRSIELHGDFFMTFELFYVKGKNGESMIVDGFLLSFNGHIVPYYVSPRVFDLPLRKGFPYLEKSELVEGSSFRKYLLYRRYFDVYISPIQMKGIFPAALFALLSQALYFPYQVVGSEDNVPGRMSAWRIIIQRGAPPIAHVQHAEKREKVKLEDLSIQELKPIKRVLAPNYEVSKSKKTWAVLETILPRCQHYPYLDYDTIDQCVCLLMHLWPLKNLPYVRKKEIIRP